MVLTECSAKNTRIRAYVVFLCAAIGMNHSFSRGFCPDGRQGDLNAKTQRREATARQAATEELNRSKQRKQRRKNFARNGQLSDIVALRRVSSVLASLRLCDFALKGLLSVKSVVHCLWLRRAALGICQSPLLHQPFICGALPSAATRHQSNPENGWIGFWV
jgi:hypothetical protein